MEALIYSAVEVGAGQRRAPTAFIPREGVPRMVAWYYDILGGVAFRP